ncbi:skin secretory protein xP2-like [Empidonax traillii]|uniref:skin secretory protein xP2-like n=1 Tax=Empidonax traillii TaxID=164674 RepID=UPI000FFCF4F0|nr:skin secretory protein xP2-like [Empidonax traillii]
MEARHLLALLPARKHLPPPSLSWDGAGPTLRWQESHLPPLLCHARGLLPLPTGAARSRGGGGRAVRVRGVSAGQRSCAERGGRPPGSGVEGRRLLLSQQREEAGGTPPPSPAPPSAPAPLPAAGAERPREEGGGGAVPAPALLRRQISLWFAQVSPEASTHTCKWYLCCIRMPQNIFLVKHPFRILRVGGSGEFG